MGSLLDKFDEWAEVEDEDFWKFIWKSYGPLIQISCMFPSYRRSMLPITLLTFAVHLLLLVPHFLLLVITIYQTIVDWDLELCSLAIHFSLMIFYAIFTLFYVQYIRYAYSSQAKAMSTDIGNYISGRIYEDKWCVRAKEENWQETLRLLIGPAFLMLGSGAVLILPYTLKTIKGLDNPYGAGMVNANLPIPAWYPFPTHEGAVHWIAVLYQLVAALSVGVIMMQVLLLFLSNAQRLRFELSVVGYSMTSILKRSMKLHLRANPGLNRDEVDMWDPKFQSVVESCLRDSLLHHQTILELLSLFTTQTDTLVLLGYSVGTASIGMSLFNILRALNTQSYESIMLFTIMIMGETLVMYILSYIGESITSQTSDLRNQLYYSPWNNFDLRNRKIFLNFHTAITEPIVITAGGLIPISLDTFSSIMNTAYSCFNLLNTQPEI
uniref:Odorant receptor n=1 Tax=Adelphocoris lineolatus TaxID=236346 RepID=A0A2I4PHA4_ADELI|nr:olfactory receptor 75 [Adelphocoris lineolatus]